MPCTRENSVTSCAVLLVQPSNAGPQTCAVYLNNMRPSLYEVMTARDAKGKVHLLTAGRNVLFLRH